MSGRSDDEKLALLRAGTSLLLWDSGKLRNRWFAIDEKCTYLFWADPSAEARGEDSTFALALHDITRVQRAHKRETVFGREPSRVPPETLALSFAIETRAGDVLEVAATMGSVAKVWFQGLRLAVNRARESRKSSPARGHAEEEEDISFGDAAESGMGSFSEYLERYASELRDDGEEEEEEEEEDDDDDDDNDERRPRGYRRGSDTSSVRSDGEFVRQQLVIRGLLEENKAMYGIRNAQDELVRHLTEKLRAREARDGDIRNAIESLTRRVRELEGVIDVKNDTIAALSGVIKDMAVSAEREHRQ